MPAKIPTNEKPKPETYSGIEVTAILKSWVYTERERGLRR